MRAILKRACLYIVCGLGLPGMALAQAPNDSFSSPVIVAGFPTTATGSNKGATREQDEPVPHSVPNSLVQASVWYRWTSPISGLVQIDTFGSDFDTVLAVWTGDELANLTLLAENDDYIGAQSAVFLNVSAGTSYRIAVYGFSSSRGGITLSISDDTTSSISGTVTGPDGTTPLPDITATAHRWTGTGWSEVHWGWADTDPNGHYTIGGLPAGTYRVQFYDWNGDYVSEVHDNALDLDAGTDIVVPAETTVTGIDATLVNASSISGTVTGPDGTTPLQGIIASAYRWTGSGWALVLRGLDVTDADGDYTIGGLRAGTYRVAFNGLSGDYVSEVYDNALDPDSGTDIVVPAGTTVTGVDASLANASKISGTVTGPDGTTPLQGISISATAYRWTGSGWGEVQSVGTGPGGGYTIGGLPAGTYRVEFEDWNGDYASEVYDNATDLDSGTDIVVPAKTTVTGINASLGMTSAFAGAHDAGGGMKYLAWFGWYNDAYWPWIWDYEFGGWLWVMDNGPENVWFWHHGAGRWMWTRTDWYRWVWFLGTPGLTWRSN